MQVTLAQHVEHAAWRADHNVLSIAKLVGVATHRRSANARMATHVEIVNKCQHHLVDLLGQFSRRCENQRLTRVQTGVNSLKRSDDEGGCLSRP